MGYDNRNLFLTVTEAGESKIMVLGRFTSDESTLPSSQMAIFSLYPHMAERARELSGVSFIKNRPLVPFMRTPTS